MSVSDNAFVQYLENEEKFENLQLKLTQKKLASLNKAITALKRNYDDNEEPQPHEEDEEDEAEEDQPQKKKPKSKKPKKEVVGPCAGRVWLGEDECPGAEANRGRNAERDAKIFKNTRFDIDGKKFTKVLCVSCKNEYAKWKQNK